MSERLVILLWQTRASDPARLATPFAYALAARALDVPVDMHFTSESVLLLTEDVAAGVYTDQARTRTALDWLNDAHAAGVEFHVCSMARREHTADQTRWLPIPHRHSGAASALLSGWVPEAQTMVF